MTERTTAKGEDMYAKEIAESSPSYMYYVRGAMEEKLKHMQLMQAQRFKQRMRFVEANPQLRDAMDHAKHQRLLNNRGPFPSSSAAMAVGGGGMEPYFPVPSMAAAGPTASRMTGHQNMRGDGLALPSTHALLSQVTTDGYIGRPSTIRGHSPLPLEQNMMDHSNARRASAAAAGATSLPGNYPHHYNPGSQLSRRISDDAMTFPAQAYGMYPRDGTNFYPRDSTSIMENAAIAYPNQPHQAIPAVVGVSVATVMNPGPRADHPHHSAAADSPQDHDKKRKLDKISDSSEGEKARPVQRIGHRNDEQWVNNFKMLKAYKYENGDCLVPRGFDENPALASWVAEQRKQYQRLKLNRKSTLSEDRLLMLQSINFEWNAQEAAWERHMVNLKKFRSEYGHVHVPLNHPDYPKLGLWAKEQRRHYALMKSGKPTHMTPERSQILESAGFIWDTQDATWNGRLVQLRRFKERYGDCNVPENWAEDPTLFQWVSHQRKQYKKFQSGRSKQIDAKRIRLLEELGFSWLPSKPQR